VGDAETVRRVEGRRKWPPEGKAALLAEIEAEGGRVMVVARRHRISGSLLYNRRSAWKLATELHPPDPVAFVPVGVIGPVPEASQVPLTASDLPAASRPDDDRAGRVEIALPDGTRVSVDAVVNETALARVFRVLKGTA
jgi:transposase